MEHFFALQEGEGGSFDVALDYLIQVTDQINKIDIRDRIYLYTLAFAHCPDMETN